MSVGTHILLGTSPYEEGLELLYPKRGRKYQAHEAPNPTSKKSKPLTVPPRWRTLFLDQEALPFRPADLDRF
jgi:hypothetical protein